MERSNINPLVSVIVITYNSSKYIIETLDSISAQTYQNLELIVSDDLSKDNTVETVRDWIEKHKSRFVDVKLVTTEINTGTSANCNRGVNESHGDWIRFIGGDDLMPNDSIAALVNQIDENKQIIIGAAIDFVGKPDNVILLNDKYKLCPYFFGKDASFQHNFILYNSDFGLTQGSIINRKVFQKVLYDEKYTVIDDLPFWLNVTKAGIKLWGCSSVVTYYRVHDSISHVSREKLLNVKTSEIQLQIKRDMILPEIPKYHLFFYETYLLDKLVLWIVVHIFNNRRTYFSHLVICFLLRLRLLNYYNKFKNWYEIRQWKKNRYLNSK